ncbi:MAG: hypothetical protein R3F30_06090 [Planctomycetota bacterium]
MALRGPGYEVGLSGHHGAWDNAGDLDLTQVVLDGEWSPRAIQGLEDHWVGGFRWQGEAAWSDIDRDAAAVAGGVPASADGFYTQVEYFFGAPEAWTAGTDPVIEPGGGFGLVHRYGRIDLDGATRSRNAVGLFFRPNLDRTIIKFEYQWNIEGGSTADEANDGFVASIATYF